MIDETCSRCLSGRHRCMPRLCACNICGAVRSSERPCRPVTTTPKRRGRPRLSAELKPAYTPTGNAPGRARTIPDHVVRTCQIAMASGATYRECARYFGVAHSSLRILIKKADARV